MQKIEFGRRIAVGFTFILLMSLLISVAGVYSMRNVGHSRDTLVADYANELIEVALLHSSSETFVATGRAFLVTLEPRLLQRMEAAHARFVTELAQLDIRETHPRGDKLITRIAAADLEYMAAVRALIELRRSAASRASIAREFETRMQPSREQLGQAIDEYVEYKREQLGEEEAAIRGKTSATIRWVTLLSAIALALGATLAAFLTRTLTRLYAGAEDATRLREDIVAIVSHDLKNPLSSIGLSTELLARKLEQGHTDAETLRKPLLTIRAGTERMTHLITSLLDFSRARAGHLQLERSACLARELLEETTRLLQPIATQRSIELEIDPTTITRLPLRCDRERLLQVLSNLAGNALKFTPAGGRVTLAARKETGRVAFEVVDTGKGISSDDLPHVFDRYWQADPGARTGTGLGLAISKGIVDAHGGRIWAESALEQGSRFTFTIPEPDKPGSRSA